MKLNRGFVLSIVITLLIMIGLQVSHWKQFSDPDGFYHAKASQLLIKGELHNVFPWLAFTTWKDNYADQHFLYHILLAPFNTVERLPISVILFALIFIASFYLVLSKLKVKIKLIWVLLCLLGSTDFLFRINLVKANTLSLALICLLIFLTLLWSEHKKYLVAAAIAIASFLFVWTYGGFVFVPVFLGLYSFALLVVKRKLDLVPFASSVLGICLGLLLHPHSNHLLPLLYDQIFLTGLGAGSKVPAGNEWLPFNLVWFLKSNIPLLLVWIVSSILAVHQFLKNKISWENFWIFSTSIAMLGLALWHRRLIEYFVPFAVLSSAMIISPYIAKLKWEELKDKILNHWQVGFSATMVVVILGAGCLYDLDNVRRYLSSGEYSDKYRQAADAMRVDSKPGEIIINTQWDQFPQLFYWNSQNYYPVGLDPTFMYIYNPEIYWQWREISDDDSSKWTSISDLHNKLKVDLMGNYLFIDSDRNSNIWEYIHDNDPDFTYFREFFNKDGLIVLKIN